MADIPYKDAHKLLRIISLAWANRHVMTYKEAAESMGHVPPQKHARAIAQMGSFLDAAACFAGVPLLALVAVREESKEINQEAWMGIGSRDRRDAIIKRSKEHPFQDSDVKAISNALNDLGRREKGTGTAWDFLRALYPGDLLGRKAAGDYLDNSSNAIDDLGTDTPDRSRSEGWTYARDSKVRDEVLRRAKGRCEFCGVLGFIKPDGTHYLESHHIIALAKDGADRMTNVIALCPNDHREAHFGARAVEIEEEMISKLKIINSSIVRSATND